MLRQHLDRCSLMSMTSTGATSAPNGTLVGLQPNKCGRSHKNCMRGGFVWPAGRDRMCKKDRKKTKAAEMLTGIRMNTGQKHTSKTMSQKQRFKNNVSKTVFQKQCIKSGVWRQACLCPCPSIRSDRPSQSNVHPMLSVCALCRRHRHHLPKIG